MAEKPILFSGPMVRALLDGKKTQTRRVMTPQPEWSEANACWLWDTPRGKRLRAKSDAPVNFPPPYGFSRSHWPYLSPYGQPGDTLWVTQEAGSWAGVTPTDRFWSRVLKTEGCWEWLGTTNRKRYGQMKIGAKTLPVHRLSWELHNGKVPSGKHVLHSCDVPWCVRPDHLRLGTNVENIDDKVSRGRVARMRGASNGGARLTEEQVADMRRLYECEDWKQSDLASRYSVSQGQVSKILSGERWHAEVLGEVVRPVGHRSLEITEVRVERVQDISEDDAQSEGFSTRAQFAADAFHATWDDLNADRGFGWNSNPWVWAISFRLADNPSLRVSR